jgi:glycosyltransferase involved in cell wall biosynthesis
VIRAAFFVYKLDTYGGAAAQAFKLARSLDSASFAVTVFNVSGSARGGREVLDGIPVVHLPRGVLVRALALAGELRSFDLVHLHGYFLMPLALALLLRRPVVLKSTLLGDDDFRSLRDKRLGWLRLSLARRVGFNNALTRQLHDINRPYLPPHRIGVIPNGVALPIGPARPKDRLFVFVGALVPRKRPHLSVAYFLEHYAHLTGARLLLIGPFDDSVPEFDAGYLASLQALVGTAPPGTVVMTGQADRPAVDAYLRSALALLFFSAAEGLPNVVLESMACDCVPVVTPMQGMAAEVIVDGRTGFILDEPAASGRDRSETLSGMAAVPVEALERIGESGALREAMERGYSLASVADRHAHTYRSLLSADPRR